MIHLDVLGVAQPKGSVSAAYDKARHRMNRWDSNSRKGKPWAAEIQRVFTLQTGWWPGDPPAYPRDVPLAVDIVFHLPRPRHTRYPVAPLGKPDVDKLIRGVLDALTGAAWQDDAQVVNVNADKVWADGAPHTSIIIDERGKP